MYCLCTVFLIVRYYKSYGHAWSLYINRQMPMAALVYYMALFIVEYGFISLWDLCFTRQTFPRTAGEGASMSGT